MKKIWKWLLGILIVVVVVAVLVGGAFVMRNRMIAFNGINNQRQAQTQPQQGWNAGPMGQRGENGFQGRAGGRFDQGQGGPMMGGGFGRGFNRGFAPFGFGLMFLGGLLRLIPLALLGLLLYAVYQFGKRAGVRSAATVAVPSPVAPAVVGAPESPEPQI
jgi:hypothetical protein